MGIVLICGMIIGAVGEQPWCGYRVSVDEVKRQTGYDLPSNVLKSVQQVIKSRVDATTI